MSFLDNVEYRCDNCGKIKNCGQMNSFICNCGGTMKLVGFLYGFRIDGKFYHGQGYVPPDLEGYHPEKNDAIAEMKGDLKRLEERRMAENNPKRRHELKEALNNFKEDYDDRVRLNQIAGKSK